MAFFMYGTLLKFSGRPKIIYSPQSVANHVQYERWNFNFKCKNSAPDQNNGMDF